jgi:hypothetical protein
MNAVFSSRFQPDPHDALDVLAFVLCPVAAFAPGAGPDEIAAVAEMIAPAKQEAIRRWQEARRAHRAN